MILLLLGLAWLLTWLLIGSMALTALALLGPVLVLWFLFWCIRYTLTRGRR